MKAIDIFCYIFAIAFVSNAVVEIVNPDQALDIYGPKNKACGFGSYANLKFTACYNLFLAILLGYTPSFSSADKVKVMRALAVFGGALAYFTYEAFWGESPFSYFGVFSSILTSIGALYFSIFPGSDKPKRN